MKKSSIFLPAAVFGILLFGSGGNVMAQYADSSTTQMKDSNVDKKTRSAQQRVAANQIRRNHLFSDLGQSYTDFKNKLNKDYGFDYAVDVSLDVYKRQTQYISRTANIHIVAGQGKSGSQRIQCLQNAEAAFRNRFQLFFGRNGKISITAYLAPSDTCLLYTSSASFL